MTDQNSQFFAILTAVGEAKQANADALGVPWTFAQMGVGDANGTDPMPSRTQTKLINERRRAPLNQVKVDPKNANVIIAEQIIPENIGVGGFGNRPLRCRRRPGRHRQLRTNIQAPAHTGLGAHTSYSNQLDR